MALTATHTQHTAEHPYLNGRLDIPQRRHEQGRQLEQLLHRLAVRCVELLRVQLQPRLVRKQCRNAREELHTLILEFHTI